MSAKSPGPRCAPPVAPGISVPTYRASRACSCHTSAASQPMSRNATLLPQLAMKASPWLNLDGRRLPIYTDGKILDRTRSISRLRWWQAWAGEGDLHEFDSRNRLSRYMRRYREPLSVPTRPDIGIAAVPLLTICRGVAGARVNDRDISENAHADFVDREAADRHRSSRLCEELVFVDERPVGVRAQEILGQD